MASLDFFFTAYSPYLYDFDIGKVVIQCYVVHPCRVYAQVKSLLKGKCSEEQRSNDLPRAPQPKVDFLTSLRYSLIERRNLFVA
jgi:hypothetical protein